MRQGYGIITSGRVVEKLQLTLVAAIAITKKEPMASARTVEGFQNTYIGREFDASIGIDGCLVEVDHAGLRRRLGIDGVIGPPKQALIGSGSPELVAPGKSASFNYL